MKTNTIYLVVGGVFILYLIVTIMTRQKSKARKSKKFLDGYKRNDNSEK